MRDFEFFELSTFKCRICGCKNKLYTKLVLRDDPRRVVGYSTRCCNCGHVLEWMDSNCSEIERLNHGVVAGCSMCIQPSPCDHKDCKLYGTCQLFKKKGKKPPKPPCPHDKKPYCDELSINYSMPPKYL